MGRGHVKDTLIIVPAFNEEASIAQVISGLLALSISVDILVVDDGSEDSTSAIASAAGVHVVRHPCNLGYGSALQTGYRFADEGNYKYVIQFDADGQHNVTDVLSIHQALCQQASDLVIGSRFKGDTAFSPGRMKWLAIHLFRTVIMMLTRRLISDPTSGLKGLNRRTFRHYAQVNRLPPDFPDADFVIDVLLKKWIVVEVAVSNRERESGTSMHSGLKPIIYMLKVLLSILVVVITASILERRQKL